jgi:hypothetical protein
MRLSTLLIGIATVVVPIAIASPGPTAAGVVWVLVLRELRPAGAWGWARRPRLLRAAWWRTIGGVR